MNGVNLVPVENITNDRLICQSCSQQKHNLNIRASKLLANVKIIICSTCEEKNFEPRYLVTIALHQLGINGVKEYIEKKLYYGDEITLAESINL